MQSLGKVILHGFKNLSLSYASHYLTQVMPWKVLWQKRFCEIQQFILLSMYHKSLEASVLFCEFWQLFTYYLLRARHYFIPLWVDKKSKQSPSKSDMRRNVILIRCSDSITDLMILRLNLSVLVSIRDGRAGTKKWGRRGTMGK